MIQEIFQDAAMHIVIAYILFAAMICSLAFYKLREK
jgi:hypothetical protein